MHSRSVMMIFQISFFFSQILYKHKICSIEWSECVCLCVPLFVLKFNFIETTTFSSFWRGIVIWSSLSLWVVVVVVVVVVRAVVPRVMNEENTFTPNEMENRTGSDGNANLLRYVWKIILFSLRKSSSSSNSDDDV